VLQRIQEAGERFGVVTRVARQVGIATDWLRCWVKAAIDGGPRA
jgi:transposase-like protein